MDRNRQASEQAASLFCEGTVTSRGPIGLIHPTLELRSKDEGSMGGHAGHASVRYRERDRSGGARDVATGEDSGN